MLDSLRTFFLAMVLLQITSLPGMIRAESHSHSACFCQLGKESCRHIERNTSSVSDRMTLDRLSVTFCTCGTNNQEQMVTNQPAILAPEVITEIIPFIVTYALATRDHLLPVPSISIWSPPS